MIQIKNGLIYGIFFMPKGFEKTLAEMNEEERENRRAIDGSYSALEKFAEWYEKNS